MLPSPPPLPPPPPPPTNDLGQSDNNGLASPDPSTLDAAQDVTDGTESGWATIAKSIGEVDKQKIKDYKEDIDTILVFVSILASLQSHRKAKISLRRDCTLQSSPHSSSSHSRPFNQIRTS